MTTARRVCAVLLFIAAAGFVWIAALTPLRSAEIAELDAEARRLGEEWVEVNQNSSEGSFLDPSEEAADLVSESNERFREARALEPPLDPVASSGAALLAISGGIALWPSRSRDEDGDETDAVTPADAAS